jgi:hypothetical protein
VRGVSDSPHIKAAERSIFYTLSVQAQIAGCLESPGLRLTGYHSERNKVLDALVWLEYIAGYPDNQIYLPEMIGMHRKQVGWKFQQWSCLKTRDGGIRDE